ncbi:hypothetical protein [Legionella quateirensis]|uniref:Uncharacterized protein n=1 Tax=Legionella quateirensis TaxID=45072 RepID=A0A378KUM4_9GAMM|nr:hypothetical protein [Legionella quateirensis]KTD43409.1 hypothetical protein Lqua_3310 [Legionella quateirensis]STY18295.1 Uncharacterised protein [Legionella quateirensis]
MKRSKSVLNFRTTSAQSQAASSVPSISDLKLKHAVFMESQKGTPAELSEAYSKIKQQLFKDRSIEVAQNAINHLEQLLVDVESTYKGIFINSLKAKCRYLLACCLLYVEAHSGTINLETCESAVQLIKSAGKLGLTGLERAIEISTEYYEKSIQFSKSYAAHVHRISTPLPRSPSGAKIEASLRKAVGESLFIHHFNAVRIYLLEEMPKLIDEMLSSAIDYDSRFGKERYLSPR